MRPPLDSLRSSLVAWWDDNLRILTLADRVAIVTVAFLATIALGWLIVQFFASAPPRRITLASGPVDSAYHRYAERFAAILRRSGIAVDERSTSGAAANVALLQTPRGADVAFVHGGAGAAEDANLRMLVTLFYEPLWIFMRKGEAVDQINRLVGRSIAIGPPGSGTAAVAPRLLSVNGVTAANSKLEPLELEKGLRALKARTVDAVMTVTAADVPLLEAALRDASIDLVNLSRADAYPRRFPHVSTLTLPAGAIDLAGDHPPGDVRLLATKAMLVARADLHPAIIDLFIDAAREVHTSQGLFEAAGEFPGIAPVDLTVSAEASRYFREGASFLHRYLPFWIATFVERLIVFGVPIVVVVAPLLHWLPRIIDWRFTQRVARWYRDLARLEVDVRQHRGSPETAKWLAELDRIRRGAERTHVPPDHASKAYAMRSHVEMVQRAVREHVAARPDGKSSAIEGHATSRS